MNHIAADLTHPRIDTITKDGRVLAGIPTAGANAINLLGCAAVPHECEVESYVLIAPSATTAIVFPNLRTPEIDAAVARIEAEIGVSAS